MAYIPVVCSSRIMNDATAAPATAGVIVEAKPG